VIAVVVAGVALVNSDGTSDGAVPETEIATDQETQYVTVVFGWQRSAFVDRLLAGETLKLNGVNATISDSYVYPHVNPDDPRSGLIARLAVNGSVTDSQFGEQVRVGGTRIRVGNEVEFTADDRTLTGQPTSIDAAEPTLQTERETVAVTVENVNPQTAGRIQPGQQELTRGEALVTVQSVRTEQSERVIETTDGSLVVVDHPVAQHLTLEVELLTLRTEEGNQFRGTTLREGREIAFDLGSRVVRGRITQLKSPPGWGYNSFLYDGSYNSPCSTSSTLVPMECRRCGCWAHFLCLNSHSPTRNSSRYQTRSHTT